MSTENLISNDPGEAGVVAKLSTLDRFLPVWILVAMAAGLLAGRVIPGLGEALGAVAIDGVSLPIALGLLIMMYPVLAKVRYDRLDTVTGDKRLLVSSLILNWVLGPALMFALAWLLLPDLPEYRTGLIIVGLARCIAMVIIWNDLACGDREAAAVLVALNSVFQVIAFGALGWFYLVVLPGWLGLPTAGLDVSAWAIVRSVLIFLGIPLLAGYLTRRLGERAKGRAWYEDRFLPRIGPFALYGLLFTIVVLFALQGDAITSQPLDVVRIALPLLIYFAVMWAGSYAFGRAVGLGYERTTTLAFTAAGNNFELAIAVAIATFGATSGQALAGVVGPLIEVPVLVALVYVSLWLRRRLFTAPQAPESPDGPASTYPHPEPAMTKTYQRHDLSIDQRLALKTAATNLQREFGENFGLETIERFLHSSYDEFAGRATVVNFLPLLAERFARQRLRALAKVEGLSHDERPTVLFLCTHNAGRSQMALGFFTHLAGEQALAWSGGSEPASEVNPAAVAAMAECGIDISTEFPKPWTDEVVRAADVVITMGCGDACPVFPGKRYEEWVLEDPAGLDLESTRPIRDEIERRVRGLLNDIGATPLHSTAR